MAEAAPVDGAPAPAGVRMAPIESLKPNPDQPRKTFDKDDLDELAASIRDKGVLQPILVRTQPGEEPPAMRRRVPKACWRASTPPAPRPDRSRSSSGATRPTSAS